MVKLGGKRTPVRPRRRDPVSVEKAQGVEPKKVEAGGTRGLGRREGESLRPLAEERTVEDDQRLHNKKPLPKQGFFNGGGGGYGTPPLRSARKQW